MSVKVKTIAELRAQNKPLDILFWVGCSGSFDDRAKKVTKAVAQLLEHAHLSFAILGNEEICTGDPARRAGNEFLFQMQALQVIQLLNQYEVKKIVTACPHCFHVLKNEYPELGGHYDVVHHSQLIQQLLKEEKIKIKADDNKEKVTYHDSCYLARANDVYEVPREVLKKLQLDIFEMKRNRKQGFCCGAGGAQLFKEPEKGTKDVHAKRADEAFQTGAKTVAVACPFCMTMLTDGIKNQGKENEMRVKDIAEMVLEKVENKAS